MAITLQISAIIFTYFNPFDSQQVTKRPPEALLSASRNQSYSPFSASFLLPNPSEHFSAKSFVLSEILCTFAVRIANLQMEISCNLIKKDVMEGLSELPSDSFDLCIVDPPYGASSKHNWDYGKKVKVKGFGGEWNLENEMWDLLSQNDSFQNTYAWLKELKRIIKLEGSIWIHATYHNSGFVNVCCQLLGLEIINEVAWYKRNSFPNLSGRRLTASHETILWVHKGGEKKRKYFFDYEASKQYFSSSDLLKEAGKQMRTVWDIPNNKSKDELKFGSHPTQKPIKVSERILTLCGISGGNLLVPFAGSGTEMVAGINFGMNVTGFEIEQEYIDIARKRLAEAQNRKTNSLF